MAKQDSKHRKDDRLSLRWGVILTVAVGTGFGTGALAGPVAGIGIALATTGLLSNILGG